MKELHRLSRNKLVPKLWAFSLNAWAQTISTGRYHPT